jgi:hypothetical protein
MKLTLNKFDFITWMRRDAHNPFTFRGLEILWDYLANYEDNTGEEIEFDPVAFRCDFSENTFNDVISEKAR